MGGHALVSGVVEEDERDDGVRGGLGAVEGVLGGADSLHGEEDRHADTRHQEEEATADALDLERGEHGPAQVPDGEDTGDEELDGRARDADRVEHLAEVVRDETVPGPLREPGEGDDDTHTLAVAGRLDECEPADVLGCESEKCV